MTLPFIPINSSVQLQQNDNDVLDFVKKHATFDFTFLQVKSSITILDTPHNWLVNLSNGIIKKLQQKKSFVIIDFSMEGFGTSVPAIKHLYYTLECNNIPPSQLIYFTSNFKDADNISAYCKQHNKQPIRYHTVSRFEKVTPVSCDSEWDGWKKHAYTPETIFVALSRVNRPWRSKMQWKLQSTLGDYGWISHNNAEDTYGLGDVAKNTQEEIEFSTWAKTNLPLLVDTTDFDDVMTRVDPGNIFERSVFHIANESAVDNDNNTSKFITEKSFKSMMFWQPVIIWGQQGINQFLHTLGYKTYEDWFDLSFDNIEDNQTRFEAALSSIHSTVNSLCKMNTQDKIKWKNKNAELLDFNRNKLITYKYEHSPLMDFIKDLNCDNST
jgi:hypothetical protein